MYMVQLYAQHLRALKNYLYLSLDVLANKRDLIYTFKWKCQKVIGDITDVK